MQCTESLVLLPLIAVKKKKCWYSRSVSSSPFKQQDFPFYIFLFHFSLFVRCIFLTSHDEITRCPSLLRLDVCVLNLQLTPEKS